MNNFFAEFLELPENVRFKILTTGKLPRWKNVYINYLNKWWTAIREANHELSAITLWESIYKGRF